MFNIEFAKDAKHEGRDFGKAISVDQAWNGHGNYALDQASFTKLMENHIPFIRIPNFATREECENLVEQAAVEGFSPYRGVDPQINRIGNTVFEYNNISKEMYFQENVEAI